MTNELKTWDREYFLDGGGDPSLFYVVYGNINPTMPMSRTVYRSDCIPKGIVMQSYGPNKHPDVPGSFREGYSWDELAANNPRFARTVAQCKQCVILRGTPENSSTLDYFRDVVGLIAYLLDHGGCAVYDPFILRWWQRSEWREAIFEPGSPMPLRHTVILVSEEGDSTLKWFHTRGMRKYGRPDISIHNVPTEYEDRVVKFCSQLMERQAFGDVIPDGQAIKTSLLPIGGTVSHAGSVDDPDFNNEHLDIRYDF